MQLEGLDCFLNIEEEVLNFQFQKDNKAIKLITLNSGYKRIAGTFFKGNIPNEAEVEHAINSIEDELMSNKDLVGRKGHLFASDKALIEVLKKNGLNENVHSRKSVEDLFSKYARVIMGAPSSEIDTDVTREDVAIVLILREIMHHLNFQELRITGQQPGQ